MAPMRYCSARRRNAAGGVRGRWQVLYSGGIGVNRQAVSAAGIMFGSGVRHPVPQKGYRTGCVSSRPGRKAYMFGRQETMVAHTAYMQ